MSLYYYIIRYLRSVSSRGRGGLGSNYIWYDFKVPGGGCALDVKFIMLD